MSAETAGASRRRRPVLPTWIVAATSGVFGLFYAYVVWNAVTLMVVQSAGPFGLNGLGWAVLGSAVAFPVLAFALAFAIGWKRKLGPFVLILLCGLALVAVFWLNIVAFAYANGGRLIG